jgi:prepilin-type N-terminal cleavage/methylation domain-containing protein
MPNLKYKNIITTMNRRKKSFHKNTKGFTLIEILVVVVIIGLILGIGIPAYMKASKNGEITTTLATANNMKTAVYQFCKSDGGPGFPPVTESAVAGSFVTTAGIAGSSAEALSKATSLDRLMLAAKFLERPIVCGLVPNRAPTGTIFTTWNAAQNAIDATAAPDGDLSDCVRIECMFGNAADNPGAGTNYRVDGITNVEAGSRIVSLVIPGVTSKDAAALANKAMNTKEGAANAAVANAANVNGTVTYAAPGANGLTTVYIFIGEY